MANTTGRGQFVKGDPRINRKGKPKDFQAFRELALQIAHEETKAKDGQPVVINGKIASVTEVILRKWAMSGDFRQQQAFMEIAYGKVPTTTEITGAGGSSLVVEFVKRDTEAA